MTKELQTVLQEVDNPETLQTAFAPLFEGAKKMEQEALAIVVTSADQKELMFKAKEMRKFLQRTRLDAEEVKKKLKASILREGRAIDGLYNLIKHLVVPLEEHLEKQEKFIEIQEAKRLAALKDERERELLKYGADISFIKVDQMPDDVYEQFLLKVKTEHEAKMEAERLARQKALAEEAAKAEEAERIRKENELLKKEAAKREAELKAKVEAEQKQRALIEQELREKANAEKVKALEEKARLDAELKAKKEAEMAPDKEKLRVFATNIAALSMPELSTDEGKAILAEAVKGLNEAINVIKSKTITL